MEFGFLEKSGTLFSEVRRFETPLRGFRLDPTATLSRCALDGLVLTRIPNQEIATEGLRTFLTNHGVKSIFLSGLKGEIANFIRLGPLAFGEQKYQEEILDKRPRPGSYEQWRQLNEPGQAERQAMRQEQAAWSYRPKISILVPVYNCPKEFLEAAVHSVTAQLYDHWELCLVDDRSPAAHIRPTLEALVKSDPRIKIAFREQNGHICRATNDALAMATGEFCALLDHDDLLTPDALWWCVAALNQDRTLDMIYSDEDKVDVEGRRFAPIFKPDWAPDTFNSLMYTCHLGVYRTALLQEIGGFRPGFEGGQDYDLVLRFTERTQRIHHIPKILYSWRMLPGSTAADPQSKVYAYEASLKALRESLARRGEGGTVEPVEKWPGHFRASYPIPPGTKCSILIPFRDGSDITETCVSSLFALTAGIDFEAVLIDNGSVEEKSVRWLASVKERFGERVVVIRDDRPFNYSQLNNAGSRAATGQVLVLLNNDTAIIQPGWLTALASWALRPSIGAVGAKLLYEDDTVQHGGVTLGIGGFAGHAHKDVSRDFVGHCAMLLVPSNQGAVTGACLAVEKRKYDAVGGLDEAYAVGLNDVDFCIRMLDRGWRNVCLPQIELYHYESKSRGMDSVDEAKQQRLMTEAKRLCDRWRMWVDRDPCYNVNLNREADDFSLRPFYKLSREDLLPRIMAVGTGA